ncbi:MAG: ribonuclease P protein component [Thiohalomonadales bacterium]
MIDCAFPRARRLLIGADFQTVFRKTRCRSADKYLCILTTVNNRTFSRLGLAIAKKKIKTSVGRQRIKRLVRESFRHHQQQMIVKQLGLDIVVMANPAASQATNHQIFASLQRHWKKLIDQCNR